MFAHGGARVILCSRSVSAAEKAIEEEVTVAGHGGYTADASNVCHKHGIMISLKVFADRCEATGLKLSPVGEEILRRCVSDGKSHRLSDL